MPLYIVIYIENSESNRNMIYWKNWKEDVKKGPLHVVSLIHGDKQVTYKDEKLSIIQCPSAKDRSVSDILYILNFHFDEVFTFSKVLDLIGEVCKTHPALKSSYSHRGYLFCPGVADYVFVRTNSLDRSVNDIHRANKSVNSNHINSSERNYLNPDEIDLLFGDYTEEQKKQRLYISGNYTRLNKAGNALKGLNKDSRIFSFEEFATCHRNGYLKGAALEKDIIDYELGLLTNERDIELTLDYLKHSNQYASKNVQTGALPPKEVQTLYENVLYKLDMKDPFE